VSKLVVERGTMSMNAREGQRTAGLGVVPMTISELKLVQADETGIIIDGGRFKQVPK
jgi:hypothetical protein